MKRKKLMLLLSMVLSSSVVLVGCKESDEGSGARLNSSAASPAALGFVLGETPLTFSFYGNYDWYTMYPWGQDPATKWIQTNKKVTVTAIQSGGNSAQKLNTMIATKNLPDMIWLDRSTDVEKLRKAGLLVPLDDYLKKYPNLKKWAGDKTLNMLRSSDGKLYQFPNWYTSKPSGNGGYMINKKIYKELGSPKLETFDDLYRYLKLVKANYPNVIPFEVSSGAQGLDFIFAGMKEDHPSAFIGHRAVPSGNQLISILQDSVFKEWLLYASKLFREKLVTQDALTQTQDQVYEKVYNGKVAVYAAYNTPLVGAHGDAMLKAIDPEAGYTMIWPLHKEGVDKNKVYPNSYNTLGWNVSVITKAAKNPEGIFAYLDWLTGPEGERIIFWGPEGTYWEGLDDKGQPILTEKFRTDAEQRMKDMAIWDVFQWAGNSTYIDDAKVANEMKQPEDKRDWITMAQANITRATSANTTEFVNLAPAIDSEEGIIFQKINEIIEQTQAKALYSKSDDEVNALIANADKAAQAAGFDKVLTYMTVKWQENLTNMKGN